MRTIAHCREHCLRLGAGCAGCGAQLELPLSGVCRAFNDWTVEALHRAGFFNCPSCGQQRGVWITGEYWGHPRQVETWTPDRGHYLSPSIHGLRC